MIIMQKPCLTGQLSETCQLKHPERIPAEKPLAGEKRMLREPAEGELYNYGRNAQLSSISTERLPYVPTFGTDKGTAAETTVYVNRNAFDAIVSETTFGSVKWDEMGVDEDKRWVVIKGQRFECEKTPEEKALMKRLRMTLLDYLQESDKLKDRSKSAAKDNGPGLPKGNLDSLVQNREVMALLKGIFGSGSDADVLAQLA